MGDLIELTTIPRHGGAFYKFNSCCVQFFVKSSKNASIGLADYPNYSRISHWVILGENSGVQENNHESFKVSTPNLLQHNKFKKLWLAWYGNKIELFNFCESKLTFSNEFNNKHLKYVTFFQIENLNDETSVSWKFILPPNIEKPILKPIYGGKTYWVQYDGILPYEALIGGYEDEFLYIMRAPHEGSLTPGKFVPSMKCGFVAWGSQSHLKTKFEILCGHNCVWIPTSENTIPAGAIAGGYTEYEGREIMYIGRALREGHVIPGKVAPSHKVCYFAYKEDTAYESKYEILIAPYSSPRCTNATIT